MPAIGERRTTTRLDEYVARWDLSPDGDPLTTATGELLPVRSQGRPAMLKVVTSAEELRAASLLLFWNGDGAARVFAHEGPALLLERALGPVSLADMARSGRDDEASRVLCAVAARLHARRSAPMPMLVPLEQWFEPLEAAASAIGGIIARAAGVARTLLAAPREIVALHGDLHHENVLDAGERGFLAIDPKALLGERSFDFANLFRNPDRKSAARRDTLARRASVVAAAAAIDRERLLRWVLSFAALSATWRLGEGEDATADLVIAELAAAELDLS